MEDRTRSRIVNSAIVAGLVIAVVGTWEGVRTVAYRDIVGVPTVCFGETRGVKMGDRYTMEECKEMLKEGLIDFEKGVRKCLVNPDRIPDKSYIAMISLAYNIGKYGFCKSSIARRANDYGRTGNLAHLVAACDNIRLYNKAGGRVVKGLVNRRAHERKLCLEGVREKIVTGIVPGDDKE